jgi:hypothetical protein
MSTSKVSKTAAYTTLAGYYGSHYMLQGDVVSAAVVALSYVVLLVAVYTN